MTSTPVLSPVQSVTSALLFPLIGGDYDADAQAYFVRAGNLTAKAKAAVNKVVVSLKAAGLWSRFDAIYPFAGTDGTANAANLKQASYGLTFVGSGTHTDGYVTDGTTAYGRTGLVPSAGTSLYAASDAHMYCYITNATVDDSDRLMGAYSASGGFTRCGFSRRTIYIGAEGLNTNEIPVGGTGVVHGGSFDGDYFASKIGTAHIFYKNGVGYAWTSGYSPLLPIREVLIGGNNNDGTFATGAAAHFRFASIGAGLDATEAQTYRGIVAQYITDMA